MFKKFATTVAAAMLGMVMLASLSACSTADKDNATKAEVIAFYTEYVSEATSIDNTAINTAYDELRAEDFTGQDTNTARDAIFERFYQVDTKLFDKLAVEYATYDDVGTTYTSVMLMSLATEAQPVVTAMPVDAVTVIHDDELDLTVYEIDRSKITAPLPLFAKSKVTEVKKADLTNPVRIIKDGSTWKIIPDGSSLNEIGIPNEK